ncbi:hypothetical protein SY83_12120 [Paenibacillus swuensis]|uniref:HTH araC/xylS-type domain-containing protein n=1 Tax=Paenibacillus swuensis TaxID=1178515 RepID=A0A172TIK9_9BACL|nr:AraC family transcriptional regulator [Paenibacillus swuensis]ANE46899.1 hypothetical protein SY83_12120 [Paenibacillus swuensis]
MRKTEAGTALASYEAGWDMGFHEHQTCELSTVLEGSGEFEANGERHRIHPGSVIFIPPGVNHRYSSVTPIRFAVIEAGGLPKEVQACFDGMTPKGKPALLRLPSMELEPFTALFRLWMRMLSGARVQRERKIAAWLEVMILFIQQHAKEDAAPLSMMDAGETIRTQLGDELRIKELAERSGMSPAAFRRGFQAVYGMSPKQYQMQARIDEAKWLLRSTSKTIQFVAEQCGFSTLHSFSAWFQQNERVAPSVWRKRQQGILGDDPGHGDTNFLHK